MASEVREGRGGPPNVPSVEVELARALAGEESAQIRLVERLTPVVQTRVGQRLVAMGRFAAPRQDVEDLTQEVFMALFKDDAKVLRDWDPRAGLSLEDFVGLIAKKRAISILRSKRRNPWFEQSAEDVGLELPSTEADPERGSVSEDLLKVLFERFRAELSPVGWRLFELLFVDERPVEEISRLSGLGHDAIYQWRSRLRKKARELAKAIDNPGGKPSPT